MQSAYLVEIGQRRRQAWMSRQVKFKIFQVGDWVMLYNSKLGPHPGKLKLRYFEPYQIVAKQGQGTFLLQDVFGTKVIKPVNGFRLKKFYGKVPENPKWMAEEIGSKSVTVSVLGVALEFSGIALAKFPHGMAVEIRTAELKISTEGCLRNGMWEKCLGIFSSGGTHFQDIIAPSADVLTERT
ncbi:hypothetical protein L7F22_022534 [Adiantum nelumboides]|nr:hypothetical protein [Adiantum nelumboides]